jgi:2-phospho-L-lactate/phosphoenolpyruvate guanylyltransferase
VSGSLAILPIKSFDEAKHRLRDALAPALRRALVQAMFTDVLLALSRCKAIDRTLVVTGDHVAQRIAGGYGAVVVEDDEQGHNAAVGRGIERALALGAGRVLLVPGDCPLLDPAELQALVERHMGLRSVVIVPDRHGSGTNALLLWPPDALEPAFGPGSRERHEQLGQAAHLDVQTVPTPSLGLDVDTPEDLQAMRDTFAAQRGGAAHTRGLLAQLARSERPR